MYTYVRGIWWKCEAKKQIYITNQIQIQSDNDNDDEKRVRVNGAVDENGHEAKTVPKMDPDGRDVVWAKINFICR